MSENSNPSEIEENFKDFLKFGSITSGIVLAVLLALWILVLLNNSKNSLFQIPTEKLWLATGDYLNFVGSGAIFIIVVTSITCIFLSFCFPSLGKLTEITFEAFLYSLGFWAVSLLAGATALLLAEWFNVTPPNEQIYPTWAYAAIVISIIVFWTALYTRGARPIAQLCLNLREDKLGASKNKHEKVSRAAYVVIFIPLLLLAVADLILRVR